MNEAWCHTSTLRAQVPLNGLASRDRARREIVDTTEPVDLVCGVAGAGTVVDEKETGAGPVRPLAPQGGARPSRGTRGAVEVHIPLPWSSASQQ